MGELNSLESVLKIGERVRSSDFSRVFRAERRPSRHYEQIQKHSLN